LVGFRRTRWLRPLAACERPHRSAASVRLSRPAAGDPYGRSLASARSRLAVGGLAPSALSRLAAGGRRRPQEAWERMAAGAAAERSPSGLKPAPWGAPASRCNREAHATLAAARETAPSGRLPLGFIDERPRPASSNCVWTAMGDARKTARAHAPRTVPSRDSCPDRPEHWGHNRRACTALAGKRTFAADTMGNGNSLNSGHFAAAWRTGQNGPFETPSRDERGQAGFGAL
jgi:hypothetical protein